MRSRRRLGAAASSAPLIRKEGQDPSRAEAPAFLPAGSPGFEPFWAGTWVMASLTPNSAQIRGWHRRQPDQLPRCQLSFFFSSIIRWMIGVRISSIANCILPPFTTIEVGVDMNEPLIMLSK